MSLVGTSLNAVTVTGPGSVIEFDTPKSNSSLQLNVTGSPTSVDCRLEGSLDGVNFFSNGDVTNAAGGFVEVSGKPVLYVRANLLSFAGGTSPTFTAIVAGA